MSTSRVKLKRLNPGGSIRIDFFDLGRKRYCCLRQLCLALGLDYDSCLRVTKARIAVKLSDEVMTDSFETQSTVGLLASDVPEWLDFDWKQADPTTIRQIRDLVLGRKQSARGRRPAKTVVRNTNRIRRRVEITVEMVSALFEARKQGLSYRQAGAPLGMSAGTANTICSGKYHHRLSDAARELWVETFGRGDPHPYKPRANRDESSLPCEDLAVADKPNVGWNQIYRIHQIVVVRGGTPAEAAAQTGLQTEVVNALMSGAFWGADDTKPPIWHELFGATRV